MLKILKELYLLHCWHKSLNLCIAYDTPKHSASFLVIFLVSIEHDIFHH